MHAYHYNRKLQPRICRVMDINEVKSGDFSAAQPISSHKYFSENQMDKTIIGKRQWETLPGTRLLLLRLAITQCKNGHLIIYEGLTSGIGVERTMNSNK